MTPAKLKALQTIHLAFCLGLFMFGSVTLLLNKDRTYFDLSLQQTEVFFPLFPGIAIIFTGLGFFLFKQRLSAIDSSASIDEKMAQYQTAFILRSAMFEASALINIVGFLLTGNLALLGTATIIFGIFLSLRPTRNSIIEALNLDYQDTEKL